MKCLVLMPFDSTFDRVFAAARDAALRAIGEGIDGIDCAWLKDVQAAGSITDDILSGIQAAAFCIADLTGNNPNVMWETGYAMALDKPTILIGQSVDTIPFDLKVHRILPYRIDQLDALQGALAESIRQTVIRSRDTALRKMPANLFWLGHDLARAIRLAMFEADDLVALRKNLLFAMHHLNQLCLQEPDVRELLRSALADVRVDAPWSEDKRKQLVVKLAQAKNALGDRIASLQPDFQAYPTLAEERKSWEECG